MSTQTKSKQLVDLLVTKFINKFKVNRITEKHLEQKIEDGVSDLLKSGQAYEKNLLKLERTLYAAVQEARNQQQLKNEEESLKKGSQKDNMSNADALSRVSGRSKAQSVRSSASGMVKKEKVVFHVDPCAKLIPTEEQWNEIVQNNLKSFHEDNERAKREKQARLKKIQEE